MVCMHKTDDLCTRCLYPISKRYGVQHYTSGAGVEITSVLRKIATSRAIGQVWMFTHYAWPTGAVTVTSQKLYGGMGGGETHVIDMHPEMPYYPDI